MKPLVGYKEAAELIGVPVKRLYRMRKKFAKHCYLGQGRWNTEKIEYHVLRGTLFTDGKKDNDINEAA